MATTTLENLDHRVECLEKINRLLTKETMESRLYRKLDGTEHGISRLCNDLLENRRVDTGNIEELRQSLFSEMKSLKWFVGIFSGFIIAAGIGLASAIITYSQILIGLTR